MQTILRRYAAWSAVAVALIGCEGETSPIDTLTAEVGAERVLVDTYCTNGGCDSAPGVSVVLTLDAADALPENDTVEIQQYRVDYSSSEINDIPYFADDVNIVLERQASASITLQIAGTRQREAVFNTVGGKQVLGTARVTLAGYDEKDARIDFSFTVDIGFGDFVVEAPTGVK